MCNKIFLFLPNLIVTVFGISRCVVLSFFFLFGNKVSKKFCSKQCGVAPSPQLDSPYMLRVYTSLTAPLVARDKPKPFICDMRKSSNYRHLARGLLVKRKKEKKKTKIKTETYCAITA